MKREIKFIFSLFVLFFIVYPNFQNFFDLGQRLNAKKIEFANLTSYYNQIKENIAEIKKEKNFEKLEKMVPSDLREAEVLNAIFAIAGGEGVLIESFSVSKQKKESSEGAGEKKELSYNKITFSLQATGDYFSLKNFLSKLQLLERIPLFESFSISKERKETEEKMKMDITFSIFSL